MWAADACLQNVLVVDDVDHEVVLRMFNRDLSMFSTKRWGNKDGNSALRSRSARSHRGFYRSSDDFIAVQDGNGRVDAAEPVIIGETDVQVVWGTTACRKFG